MAVTTADESRHEPTEEPNWQENYMFLGWDEASGVGIYLHLGHLPGHGMVDVRALVHAGGTTVSAAAEFPASECLDTPWVDANIVSPLERWKLRFGAAGVRHEPGSQWLASAGTTGDVDFGFDIELESTVPAVDWADAWEQLGIPNIMSRHYEAGCRWRGTVWSGGESKECSGLMIRDHSWGPRDLKNAVRLAWWLPVVFDDGRSYITGASLLRGGSWTGFVLEERGDGPVLVSTDPVVRVDGLEVPSGFDSATVLQTRDGGPDRVFAYEARLHTPVFYETMGSHRLDDVFCRVTTSDGRTGFGNLELNLPQV